MLKVLVADAFPEEKIPELEALGVQVTYHPGLKADTLPDHIQDTHILCIRSTKVTTEAIQRAKQLMLIVRVGSGTNTIDVESASKRGIYVANCPGKNAIAVAELTIGLMVCADRRIPQATASLKAGKWEKKAYSQADGLKGKTMGIVGLGQIGKEVAKRAKAFGIRVGAWDRFLTPDTARSLEVDYHETLEELLAVSDIVTVHLPLTEETREMFNKERFTKMKNDAIFINTSRGEVHNRDALLEAITNKGIRPALDVFVGEPPGSGSTFTTPTTVLDSFVGTPHIGASTRQAQLAVASEAIRVVSSFLNDGIVHNCVNLQKHTKTSHQLIVRHFDKVGVLASVLNVLQQADINIEEMNNTIFKSGEAAVATLSLNKQPEANVLAQLEAMEDKIIQVMLV